MKEHKRKKMKFTKELPHNIKAVLFDYDGVIGDTMEANLIAWKKAFRDYGVSISDNEYLLLEGMTPAAIAKKLGIHHGLDESVIEAIPAKKAEYYRANNTFRVYPFIHDLLDQLKKRGIKLALVSGAASHRIDEMTPPNLLSLFDVVISADDKVEPKPAAGPYLQAMKLLSLEASDVVVIENAPLGIQSAKAAGCYCIALETTLPKDELRKADIILSTHEELIPLFF